MPFKYLLELTSIRLLFQIREVYQKNVFLCNEMKKGPISWDYIVYFILALLILLFAFLFAKDLREAMINLIKNAFAEWNIGHTKLITD